MSDPTPDPEADEAIECLESALDRYAQSRKEWQEAWCSQNRDMRQDATDECVAARRELVDDVYCFLPRVLSERASLLAIAKAADTTVEALVHGKPDGGALHDLIEALAAFRALTPPPEEP